MIDSKFIKIKTMETRRRTYSCGQTGGRTDQSKAVEEVLADLKITQMNNEWNHLLVMRAPPQTLPAHPPFIRTILVINMSLQKKDVSYELWQM